MKNFVREKRIYCGDYLEVDIVPRSKTEMMPKGKRNKKKKLSVPKQKRLNDKNARRYFIQLVNTNFGQGDYHVTATYSDDELPGTLEEAEREIRNYIRRIDYRRKKEGLEAIKYVLVTEFRTEKNGVKPIRIHHHMIINGGLNRDVIESLWSRRRKKGERQRKQIGFVNVDRLQPNNFGLEALGRYLMKDPQGKKRWSSSQKLDTPYMEKNDNKYSKRGVEKIVRNSIEDKRFWEKQYPGYYFTDCKAEYNELTGWSIYLKMRKADKEKKT